MRSPTDDRDVLSIALLQVAADGNNLEANAVRGERACREAAAAGADIAVFPEMWSVGYTARIDHDYDRGDPYRHPDLWTPGDAEHPVPGLSEVWAGLAIDTRSDYFRRFQRLAAELGMAIVVTYLESWDGLPRNTCTLVDPTGQIVLTYAKVHTCAFDLKEAALTPGEEFGVATLQTRIGPIEVGMMICYDREFPESARELMLGGAELILSPSCSSMNTSRLGQVRVRSEENMLAIAMANAPGPGAGLSAAFDGQPYRDGQDRDPLIVQADENEAVVVARLELDHLRRYRQRETWADAFRRPSTYRRLATRGPAGRTFIRTSQTGGLRPR